MFTENNGIIDSQGSKIHYISNTYDSKKSTLLFIPGVMMPGWIWEKQLSYFADKYNVVAIDPRSQGQSELATEGHYALSIAKDIKNVIDILGLKDVILIGWSLGVAEVVNYAVHFGTDNLKGLVLVDGIVGMDPSLPFYKSTVNYWTELQTDRVGKTKEFIKLIFKKPQSEDFIKRLTESAMRTPTNTVMAYLENFILQDFRPLLPLITYPTLIVTVPGPRLSYIKNMQKTIPNAEIEIYDDAAHTLFVDQPDKFNQSLEKFLEKIATKAT